MHHSALHAYQLQLERVLREVAAAEVLQGSSHLRGAVDLVSKLFKVRLSTVRVNSPGIRFLQLQSR